MKRLTCLALALTGCVEATDEQDAPDAPEPVVVLAATLSFVGESEGVSNGFDLDGLPTGACGVDDYVGPDGTEGIDNSFAGLMPLIEVAGGRALYGLVQEAVDMGELLIMIEATGLDEAAPGDCVPARTLRAQGDPVIGGHGSILPGQTFDVNGDFPVFETDCGVVEEDGSLRLDGFTYRLPLRVLDETVDLTLLDGRARLTRTEDGWQGLFAGGVSSAELSANVNGFDAIPASIASTVDAALATRSDLSSDGAGACDLISVTMAFEGVSAYLFDDGA